MFSRQSVLIAEPPPCSGHAVDWQNLVYRIQQGDEDAREELYGRTHQGVRILLSKRKVASPQMNDAVHDIFTILVNEIRQGSIRNAEELPGFLRTVTLRTAATLTDQYVAQRPKGEANLCFEGIPARCPSSEEDMAADKQGLFTDALRKLPNSDREILTRFYLHEESQEHISEAFGLTESQFRVQKVRAKQRLEAMVGRMERRRNTPMGLLRQITVIRPRMRAS